MNQIDYFIPTDLKLSIEERKKLRVFLSICFLAAGSLAISFTLRYIKNIHYGHSNLVGPVLVGAFLAVPFLVKYTKKVTPYVYSIFTLSIAGILLRCIYDEYLYSTALLWLMPVPSVALTIFDRKKSLPIAAASFAAVGFVAYKHNQEFGFAAKDPNLLASYIFVMTFITIISYIFDREKENAHKAILDYQNEHAKKQRINMLGEMVSGLAHEINNPLTIVIASSTILDKEIQNLSKDNKDKSLDKIKNLNTKVIQHSARINRLISSLREYSKNDDEIKKELINLNDFLVIQARAKDDLLKKHGIELRLKLSDEELWTEANESLLRQAIHNLIDNSIDAITPFLVKWIELELKVDHKKVIINITDSGFGIPLEHQDKLMSAFFTTKEIGKGIGIGLLLSARYLELNKGKLQYNKDSKHTQFTIEFDYQKIQKEFAREKIKEFENSKKVA